MVVSEIDVLRSKKMHPISVLVGKKKVVGYCLGKISSGFSFILKMALIFILGREKKGGHVPQMTLLHLTALSIFTLSFSLLK